MRRLGAVAVAAAACVGCGNETGAKNLEQTTETGAAAQASQTLQLEAAPNGALRFDVKILKANAGRVQLLMTNPSSVPHDIAVKGNGLDEKGKVVSNGAESRVTVDLKPGKYEFYCSVPGHAAAGMKGELIVGAPK